MKLLFFDNKSIGDSHELPPQPAAPCWNGQPTNHPGKVPFAIRKLFPMLHYKIEVM